MFAATDSVVVAPSAMTPVFTRRVGSGCELEYNWNQSHAGKSIKTSLFVWAAGDSQISGRENLIRKNNYGSLIVREPRLGKNRYS